MCIRDRHISFCFAAFNTSDWGTPGTPDYFGPILDDGEEMPATCKFSEFRDNQPGYPLSQDYYKVLLCRVGFVLLFQVHILMY